jgi:hypothetical protein
LIILVSLEKDKASNPRGSMEKMMDTIMVAAISEKIADAMVWMKRPGQAKTMTVAGQMTNSKSTAAETVPQRDGAKTSPNPKKNLSRVENLTQGDRPVLISRPQFPHLMTSGPNLGLPRLRSVWQ